MPKITGTHVTTVEATGTGEIWTVTRDAILQPPANTTLSALEESGTGNTIQVFGKIISDWRAISSTGINTVMEFGASARITGSVNAFGVGAEITNHGRIHALEYDVAVTGNAYGFQLRNYAKIEADGQAAVVIDSGATIINAKGATISGEYGVRSYAGSGEPDNHIINHGLIAGSEAIGGSWSTDIVRNHGKIAGIVTLERGNDTFDNRGGKVIGEIRGGVGDDTLITDNANYKLTEISGQGEDQVRSTVSYTLNEFVEHLFLIGKKNINGTGTDSFDYLNGNAGNNTLKGLGSFDELDGRGGNDTLIGGTGNDRFYFNKGYDRDTIRDFHQGEDKVDVEDWAALSSFAEAKSHASNHGQDVWIKVGDDVLVINGLHKADLTIDDFVFF